MPNVKILFEVFEKFLIARLRYVFSLPTAGHRPRDRPHDMQRDVALLMALVSSSNLSGQRLLDSYPFGAQKEVTSLFFSTDVQHAVPRARCGGGLDFGFYRKHREAVQVTLSTPNSIPAHPLPCGALRATVELKSHKIALGIIIFCSIIRIY